MTDPPQPARVCVSDCVSFSWHHIWELTENQNDLSSVLFAGLVISVSVSKLSSLSLSLFELFF